MVLYQILSIEYTLIFIFGITTLQKSVFKYSFMRFMFVFCPDRMKATQTIKNIVVFRLHSS